MSSLPRSHRPLPPHPPTTPRSLPEAPPPPKPASSIPVPCSDRRVRSAPRLEPVVEGDPRFLREVRKPPPGDSPGKGVPGKGSSPELSKQRSLYFEQAFGSERAGDVGKEGEGPRERATVLAEVKTNVFVVDEMSFMTKLSQHLSVRYNRPIAYIAVTLQHGACLLVGGTLEPAYSVAVHALSGLLEGQVATNKRNAALLQRHLGEALGVPPGRGLVRFVGIPEECLARGGRTVAGEMTEESRVSSEGGEEKVQRRRTIRPFTKPKHPANTNASQRPSSSPGPSGATRTPSEPSHDTSQESSVNHQQQASPRRSLGDQGGLGRSRSLRHKKSFNFIQNLFSRGVKPELDNGQPTIQEE